MIFQDALERELVRAMEPYQQRDADRAALVPASRFWAGVYWQAHRSTAELREVQEAGFTAPEGTDPRRLEAAVAAYKLVEQMRREVEEECPSSLQRVGVPVNPGTLEQALIQRLRGRAAAHERAQLAADPRISSRDDLLGTLLDDALIAAVRDGAPLLATASLEKHLPAAGIYLEQDTRHLWDVIDDVCRAIVATKDWNNDLTQRKRIMKAFAWMTGNKRLCDYRPSDIAGYKAALVRLPTTFRWVEYLEQPDGGYPNIDFAAVLQQLPEEPKEHVRDDRTINRDLSTMNRVAKELAKSAWELLPAGDKAFSLAVERLSGQPTHFAVNRGTLSHGIFEGESAVAFLDGGMLKLRVACRAQAGALDDRVPFAVAISIEAGIGSGIAVYDEVRAAVQPAIRAAAP
jgi:hypothetical protein